MLKKQSGVVIMDTVIAIIAIMVFSVLIISLIRNNVIENVKLKKETMAMIYITEIFENIGKAKYDDVTIDNMNNFVPEDVRGDYVVDINIKTDFPDVANYESIMKKVTVKLSYELNDKTYSSSMERIKIKE